MMCRWNRLSLLTLAGILQLFFCRSVWAQSKIVRQGATVVNAMSPKGKVSVTIHTAIFDRSCACPCLMTRVLSELNVKENVAEISVIQQLEISVGGKSIAVPSSVYEDLWDPHEASLSVERGAFVLKVLGADGAYAYFIRAFFDSDGVHRVLSYDAEAPDKPVGDMRHF